MARSRRPTPVPTLASALEIYRVKELRSFAGLVLEERPSRKAELVEAIAAAVTAPGRLAALVERLTADQSAALAEAVHEGAGTHDADRFRAKYGRDANLGRRSRWGELSSPSLLHLFLHRPDLEGTYRVPDELLDPLRAELPKPSAPALRSSADLPDAFQRPMQFYDSQSREWRVRHEPIAFEVRETEAAARHDVRAVLALADAGGIAITRQKKHPTAAATRAVAEVLIEGDFYAVGSGGPAGRRASRGGVGRGSAEHASDAPPDAEEVGPIRAFAWPLLLQAGGLARPWGGKLKLTAAGRAAMGAPPEDVLSALWDAWETANLLDEFSRVEAIRGQSGHGRRGLTSTDDRRAAVVDALASCPIGEWIGVEELWRFMRAAGHDFVVSRNLWELYIAEKQYGALGYEGYGTWEVVQGRYVLALLFEYAATLGLVDVAYVSPAGARVDFGHIWGADDLEFLSRYDGLAWIRLTPLGAWCLRLTDAYEPVARAAGRGTLRVLPNLEVAVLDGARVSPADRLVLDRFAEPVGERVWRLDRQRILGAVEQGHEVGALRGLLASGAGGEVELPDTVEAFLRDTAERASKLRDRGAARLVDCGEPELAALLSSHGATRSTCMRAGDHYVAVPAGKEAAFRRGVRRLGYVLPAPS